MTIKNLTSATKTLGLSRGVTVSAIAVSLLFTAGCTSDVSQQPATTSLSAETATTDGSSVPNTGEKINNGKGSYLQSTINDEDPAMKYDESIADEKIKKLYSPEELASAQKTAVRFLAEETIDSTVQGGGDPNKWLAENKDKFEPGWFKEASVKVKTPKSGLLVNNPDRAKAKYDLAYDEKSVRLVERNIKVLSITENKGRPFVQGTVSYGLKTNDGNQEVASGKFGYALTKSGGKWLLSGYRNQISITPFTMPVTAK